jgi:transposase
MPKKTYRLEFKRDAVALVQQNGASLTRIALDLGVASSTLQNWVHKAEIDDGVRPATATADAAEIRELSRRKRLLEQEVEVMRRAVGHLSRAVNPK